VRTLVVVLLPGAVESLLLSVQIELRRAGRLGFQRSMQAFQPSVLAGLAGLDALVLDPSLIHHSVSRERPRGAWLATKGIPLSLRMACGSAYSAKSASKVERTPEVFVEARAVQPSSVRLYESPTVSG
jgi:hypothetical protein